MSKYHAMNYNYHYESTFVVVYLHDEYNNRIYSTLQEYVDTSEVANNQIQVNGVPYAYLEPQMYALFQSSKDLNGTRQATFVLSSDIQAVTLVKLKDS